jgi:hypothetical protein
MEDEMGAPHLLSTAPWSRWDRLGIWILFIGACAVAAGALVSGLTGVVSEVVSGTRTVTLLTDSALPPRASAGSAALLEGHFATADVRLGDLSAGTAGLLTTGSVLGILVQSTVALSFAYLAWRLLRAEPFIASLTVAFIAAGAALAIGGLVAQLTTGFGQWNAVLELGRDRAGDEPFWPLAMALDPAPIGFGFALLIVASAFQYGERLTRETEGLV